MTASILGGFLQRLPVFVGMILCLCTIRASAQVLVIKPACGQAGKTNVSITGSGWAEPNPPCRYKFFLDGAVVAPDQQDGLFGPPNSSFVIPNGTPAGKHTVRVELRENDNDALLQARQSGDGANPPVPFLKVVQMEEDPFKGNITTAGPGINIGFNPANVCDVTPCKKIVFIQVVKNKGTKMDGSTTTPKPSDLKLPGAATKDKDVTAQGFYVDYLVGEKDPYYNGDDVGFDSGVQGFQDDMPVTAKMSDAPGQPDKLFPAGVLTLEYDFETAVFCASGDNSGEYVGVVNWKWVKTKGGAATASLVSTSRGMPSADFTTALNQWDTNHGFTLP